jgi:hypothetical protein
VNDTFWSVLARHFGLSGDWTGAAEPKQVTPGFSGAQVWRWVDSGGRHFAIRRTALPEFDPQEEANRWLFAQTWQAEGLPVSVPLKLTSRPPQAPAANALPAHALAAPCDPLSIWTIEPWLPGRSDFSTNPSAKRLASTMTRLAQLHEISERASALQPFRWHGPPAGLMRRLKLWHDQLRGPFGFDSQMLDVRISRLPEPLQTLGRLWRHAAPRYASALLPAWSEAITWQVLNVPSVRDLWHDHLLFTGDDLTGLIDLHAAATDSPVTDLARLLGSLFPHEPDRWREALSIYESRRPLSPTERACLPLYERTSILLSGTHWLNRALQESEPLLADLPRVTDRWTTLCERLLRPLPLFPTM